MNDISMEPYGLLKFKGEPWSKWIESHVSSDHAPNLNDEKEIQVTDPKESYEKSGLLQFKGQAWSKWANSHIINADINKETRVEDTRVTKLPYEDRFLYGLCPLVDPFIASICSTCGAVVKEQAMKCHIEIRHPAELQKFILSTPKQLTARKSRPNVLSKKFTNVNVAVHGPVPKVSTLIVENATSSLQTVVSLKPLESGSIVAAIKSSVQFSSSKSSTVSTVQSEPSNISRRKSPNNDKKRSRDKSHDLEKIGSSQEPSSARTNPAKIISQKRIASDSCRPVVVHRSSSNVSSVKAVPKPILEKYIRKGIKVAVWPNQSEDTQSVHGIHREGCAPYKIVSTSTVAATTNTSSKVGISNATTNPQSTLANNNLSSNNSPNEKQLLTSTSADWSKVQLDKMLFNEPGLTDSLLPTSLVTSDTSQQLPELSSTPQTLSERLPTEPEPLCTPPNTSPCATPAAVMQSPNIPCIDPPILDADTLINSISPFGANAAGPADVRRPVTTTIVCVATPIKTTVASNPHPVTVTTADVDQTKLLQSDGSAAPAETTHLYHASNTSNIQPRVTAIIKRTTAYVCDSGHQLLKVLPASAPPYAVKVSSSNPVLILSPKEPSLPVVNLNVNTESSNLTPVIRKQFVKSGNACGRSLLKPRTVKVPITVQMPLQEKVNNITFYKTYPRPIAQSNFSAKKVGGALLFNSKRVNVVRNDFKSVLSKKGKPTLNAGTIKQSQATPTGATIYTAKPLGPNNNCRFPKTISVIPSINANTILAHRPNILRASLPQKAGQHVPKILATGLKRPANSSPHITNISDCKHLLLTPGVNNIIGKMIVHPRTTHEVSETADGASPSQIMDKVVTVNIK